LTKPLSLSEIFFKSKIRALGWESDRLDTRSPVYKRLPLFQLSERAAYSYQYPGFRFAPPWAEVSYAFGVPPENAPIAELFFAVQIQKGFLPIGYASEL
jgi:hypothetical protein